MAKNKKSERKKEDDRSGLFIPAGIFIGLGLGLAFGQAAAGLFIGLGAGFLAMALMKYFYSKR
jgi:hypothetical protein